MSWAGRSDKPWDKFRPTLVARARKRTGWPAGYDAWTVMGESRLGDTYEEYQVQLIDGKYLCSCHGDYESFSRHMCSHSLWAMLVNHGEVAPIPGKPRKVELEVVDNTQTVDDSLPSDLTSDSPLVVDPPPPAVPAPEGLPEWVEELRPHQVIAVDEIMEHFLAGKKVVILDAPTGSGKTLIGELVRRRLNDLGVAQRAIYCCTTKTLQDQVVRDFDYARVIKGRNNYPTLDSPGAFPIVSAEACHLTLVSPGMPGCGGCNAHSIPNDIDEYQHCDQCHPSHACPYRVAKDEATFADLAVLNTAYYLAEGNVDRSRFANRPLAIVDEADELESELMRHIEVVISKRKMKALDVSPPTKKTVSSSWVEWVRGTALPAVTAKVSSFGPDSRLDASKRKQKKGYQRLQEKLKMLMRSKVVDEGDEGEERVIELEEGWVYTGYDKGDVVFKPIRVDAYAADYLWHLADRFLLMSATIISSGQMAEDLGLEDHEWALVQVPSTFAPEVRPIYVEPVANMTFKEKAEEWPKMLARITKVVKHHDDERVLIHTVSYALAGQILKHLNREGLGHRTFTYFKAAERETKLEAFLSHPQGIMVAPSFERGVDLRDDDCRVVIVAKIPYLNLKDKQISARLHLPGKAGQAWYSMLTVRSLVQMTGRAMRSAEDHCEIYLLDKQFIRRIWRHNRQLLPTWWKEALVMGGSDIPR